MDWSLRLFCCLALAGGPLLRAEAPAARVIVLANSADDDSVRIARHYAEVRGVPPANVFTLPMPRDETISWSEFVESIWEPFQRELVRQQWIDAIPMKLIDEVGRTKLAFSGHRISYLVVCRGVPLRIRHDPALYAAVAPLTDHPLYRTNAAAVDSELSLLAHPGYPINAFLSNPLFHDDHPSAFDLGAVIKVSRLDGPTVGDAVQLVDRAVEAERSGLIGRAYVDLGGQHPLGDRWLETTLRELRELGFDTDVDRAPSTMPATARFDAPVLYFGWYAGALNGPFALPGFRFPAGAIAFHIHSYSAETLRSAEERWCGPLVARGVTATVGNVFEPTLELTHRPDLLLQALARGDTWGDAVMYAEPALSWQTIAIGDPLYRPFSLALDTQWSRRSRLSNDRLGYVVVRRMLQLEASHRQSDALELARRVQADRPSLALGVALGERLEEADNSGARAAVPGMPAITALRPDEWALARKAAEILFRSGHPAAALATLRGVLDAADLPTTLRDAWLREGVGYAEAAGDRAQAEKWRQQLALWSNPALSAGPQDRPAGDAVGARSGPRSGPRARRRWLPSRSDRSRDRCPG